MRIARWGLTLMSALMVGATMLPNTARSAVSFNGAYSGDNLAVDVSYFYDELAPYGQWMDYGSYGWCWVPDEVAASWRPYSNGHWIYTDYGWTWASYEPWGWAVYHYGRWVADPSYGWVWVPGTEWAPAWVAWRGGDDCIGWAPLPPGASWNVSVGLTFGDSYYDRIPYQGWCFVPQTRFLDTDLRARIVSWDRNRVLLPQSRDYTRFASRDGWPVNQGIPVNQVERWTGHGVQRLRVSDLSSPGAGHGMLVGRDAVGYFRPHLRDGSPRVAPREDARMMVRGADARDNGPDRRPFDRQRVVQRPDFGRQREVQQPRMDQRLRENGVERRPSFEPAPSREWQRGPDRPQPEFNGNGGGGRERPQQEFNGNGGGGRERPQREFNGNGGGGRERPQQESRGGGGGHERPQQQSHGNSDRGHRDKGKGHDNNDNK